MNTATLCKRIRRLDRLYLSADTMQTAYFKCAPRDRKRLRALVNRRWRAYRRLVNEFREGGAR